MVLSIKRIIMSLFHHLAFFVPCCPVTSCFTDHLGDKVFQRTPDDDELSLSVEDDIFLGVMNREMYID